MKGMWQQHPPKPQALDIRLGISKQNLFHKMFLISNNIKQAIESDCKVALQIISFRGMACSSTS
jgi:hypothetical protein